MPTEAELLTTLRDAVQQKDWEKCHDTLELVLACLPVRNMLDLAHQEVQRRLPLFERHHPHMHWPRIWLDALATKAPVVLDEATDEVIAEAPGPGGNNFTEAVRQLALAAAATGTKCVTHAMEAIEGAIMAEQVETAGSENRELWDLGFQDELAIMAAVNEEREYEPLYPFAWVIIMDHPKVAAVELAAWNQLVDELAAALGVADQR